jgi:hypothetical protein
VFITRAHTGVNDVSVSSSVPAKEMKRYILHSGCYIKPLVFSRPDKNIQDLKKKLATFSGIKTKVNFSCVPLYEIGPFKEVSTYDAAKTLSKESMPKPVHHARLTLRCVITIPYNAS